MSEGVAVLRFLVTAGAVLAAIEGVILIAEHLGWIHNAEDYWRG